MTLREKAEQAARETNGIDGPFTEKMADAIERVTVEAVAVEREACAQVADRMWNNNAALGGEYAVGRRYASAAVADGWRDWGTR